MKTDLFQSCGHWWAFQFCWHIECSTFTASSFRIWNSSTGIPSPPRALSIVMLPKAHLTSHSRMFGSRWVITPSWLSGSWRSFLYSSSVYSYHLFLTSSSALLTMPKPLTVWITINCGKFWKKWENQTTLPASWEVCMKKVIELDMEYQTGSKGVRQGCILSPCLFNLRAEYIKQNARLNEA